MDPLTDEGLDAVAVFSREVWIAERPHHFLQPTLDGTDFPLMFRQLQRGRWKPLAHNPKQSFGFHCHTKFQQIFDTSLVRLHQQGFGLSRTAALE